MNLEKVKVRDLKDHPQNYNIHNQDQIDHIKQSLIDFGYYKNIVISEDNYILAGHGVRQACDQLDLEEIPVKRLNIKHDTAHAHAVIVADNEIQRLGTVDDRKLTNILKQVHESGEKLLGTGFNEKTLSELIVNTRHETEVENIKKAADMFGFGEESINFDETCRLKVKFRTYEAAENFCKKYNMEKAMEVDKRKWKTKLSF